MLKKCDGRTDERTNERTDERTNGQTDLCIELRYAQLIMTAASEILHHQDKDNTNIYSGVRGL